MLSKLAFLRKALRRTLKRFLQESDFESIGFSTESIPSTPATHHTLLLYIYKFKRGRPFWLVDRDDHYR